MPEWKHTPGPWIWRFRSRLRFTDVLYSDSEGKPSVLIARDGEVHMSAADARLIEAAPDLLAALKRLAAPVGQFSNAADYLRHMDAAIKHAEALISQAEGGTDAE